MKKSAFTLIETVLVMTMIGILMMGLISFFSDRTLRERYQAETCFNQLSQQLDNFVNAALMGKKLTISFSPVLQESFPDYYEISLLTSEQTIRFSYRLKDQSSNSQYLKILLTGHCNQPWFYLSMTGATFTEVVMNKGFRALKPGEISAFYLSWTSTSSNDFPPITGEVQFQMCLKDWEENNCSRDVGRRYVDTRVQAISPQKCQFYSSEYPDRCQQRQGS